MTGPFDACLAPVAAVRPLRLVRCRPADSDEFLDAARRAELPVIDVKRLTETEGDSELVVLRSVAALLRPGAKPVPDRELIESIVRGILEDGPTVVVARITDDLAAGMLRRFCGIGRRVNEETASRWRRPVRVVLALGETDSVEFLVTSDESSVLDFCDPGEVLDPSPRLLLPRDPERLSEGLTALAQVANVIGQQDLGTIVDWPRWDPALSAPLMEQVPRNVFRRFVADGSDADGRAKRGRLCLAAGVAREDLCEDGQARAVGIRNLAMLLLPPNARPRWVVERNLFPNSDVHRYLFRRAGGHEELEKGESDALLGMLRGALNPWLGMLARTDAVAIDALSLDAAFDLARVTREDLARLQAAAALEVLYRMRIAAAHGTPRGVARWQRASDQVASCVALGMLGSLQRAFPDGEPVPVEVLWRGLDARPDDLEGARLLRKLEAEVGRGAMARTLGTTRSLPMAMLAAALAKADGKPASPG